MKPKKQKTRYKGSFNYRHSIHILYCYATSERSAWKNFCFTLSKKHEVAVWYVMQLFSGWKDNFSIERVTDEKCEKEGVKL